MAIFGKKKSAEEILRLIADLPDDEREALKAQLNGDTAEKEEEVLAEEAKDEEKGEEGYAAEDAEKLEVFSDTEEEEEGEEPAAPAVEEAEAVAEGAEAEAEEIADEEDVKEDRDLGAEVDKIKEALASLSNRLDAMLSKQAEHVEEDEEIGQAFGPDITDPKKVEDNELERARFAAFGF